MSKYGSVARTQGHAQWFLKKTLTEHDRSMDDPWMQMIYSQSFTIRQYAAWLARNHAVFSAMEQHVNADAIGAVHDVKLLRTKALEADLSRLLGEAWRLETAEMVAASEATQLYLKHLEEDAISPHLLLAHHFLQYNAVLSGGAYLGKMVSEKLCVPHGAPGVQFYAFAGVDENKGPARVQQYIRDFDTMELDEETRNFMLPAMIRIYEETEAMMKECYDINPAAGVPYAAAKDSSSQAGPAPIPSSELLELSLEDLHGYTGADEGRILISLAGELLDVSAGRELYGPGGGYALLAGHDVTCCLATMSLEPAELDDLRWEPDNAEDEKALGQWREKLKAKYPIAGSLKPSVAPSPIATGGLRQRSVPSASSTPAPSDNAAPSSDTQKCPISGKEGTCPMAGIMGIGKSGPAPKAEGKPATNSKFMAGKSLVAAVEKGNSSGDSFLYRLCPLHWDDNTMRLLVLIAATSWVSGIFIGWNLHRALMS